MTNCELQVTDPNYAQVLPFNWVEIEQTPVKLVKTGFTDTKVCQENYFQDGLNKLIEEGDLTGAMIKDLCKSPTMTRENEKIEFSLLEKGRYARERLIKYEAENDLTAGEKKQLFLDMEEGLAARERIIAANTRLVVSIAKLYQGRGVRLEDLILDGNLGLLDAVRKYNLETGNRFSTFAYYRIRQKILLGIINNARQMRIPQWTNDRIGNLLKTIKRLQITPDTDEHINQIAEASDIIVERVIDLWKKHTVRVSRLDTPIDPDNSNSKTLGDLLEDPESIIPDPKLRDEFQIMKKLLLPLLQNLSPRDQEILKYYFLDTESHNHSLADASCKFGLTRERIRQICRDFINTVKSIHQLREKLLDSCD